MTFLRTFVLLLPFLLTPALPADAIPGPDSYASLLKKVVGEKGVKWGAFKADEKKQLADYLEWAATTLPAQMGSPSDRTAFWINSHNACVMKFILDRWPVSDVMQINGFRDELRCELASSGYSLNQIVEAVISPVKPDPRVHFALWWGTKGSPPLSATPYEGKTLDASLDAQVARTLAGSRFVSVDPAAKKMTLSPVLDWYKYSFGPSPSALLSFLRKRLPADKSKYVPKKYEDAAFSSFDWSLDRDS